MHTWGLYLLRCFHLFHTELLIHFQVATGLFDLVSSNSDIDHPLCEECTDALLDLMDTTLSRTQKQALMSQQLQASLADMPNIDVTALENELKNVSEMLLLYFNITK